MHNVQFWKLLLQLRVLNAYFSALAVNTIVQLIDWFTQRHIRDACIGIDKNTKGKREWDYGVQ